MNRRRFVVISTVSLVVVTLAIAGLAYYSDFAARAFTQGVPNAIRYLPSDTKAVFGMNVKKFIASPIYAQIMQKHEQQIGTDLTEFIAATGVDPRRDVDYIIGAARPSQTKGAGAVIAVGRFTPATIINFINTKYANSNMTPVRVDYAGGTVLMLPDTNRLEKGIAFLSDYEVALGDLESLKAVLDVRNGSLGVLSNATMQDLLNRVSPEEMFWFAGDGSVLAKVPANTQFVPTLSAVQSVFGTLNLDATISGKVSVLAKDATSAGQLADFARGIIALGNLAGAQNPVLADIARGVQIAQNASQFDITITLPIDILQKLEAAKGKFGVDVPNIR
jgi:hypothetical protein